MKRKYIQTTIRVEKEIYKEYRKWLIDNGYKSVNQHLNELIKRILEKNNRIPLSYKKESILRQKS